MTLLKFFMLLALAVWLGGIIFFTAVEAPAVLHNVADRQLGGSIISQSLWNLHWLGIACGLVFLISSMRLAHLITGRAQAFMPSHLLALTMLALTLVSQRAVLPALTLLRTSGGAMPGVQAEFQRLHNWSVGLEAGTLLLGLLLLYLTARRFQ